ncbi:MAG: hypothetical protein GTO76_05615 [Planctomycetales bacterium]|nr:hypothetical protein [Planctomycetales bacterium]NIN08135.1 hypothetical protein [Planctomycetales bacterium]NIN77260.1 hypothetical protein [Planctomycetales bacterium]NIO34449.1 hypothetical protein [Planctomycetales bacterium]NIO46250.1 hypothetical protein [Planctomycetales bacterium]
MARFRSCSLRSPGQAIRGTSALICWALIFSGTLMAADISMEHHSWGRFEPGAWQQTRTVTETLDEGGQVIGLSTAEQKMTLVAIGPDNVEVRIESTVEVGGKKFTAPVQTLLQGSHGEIVGLQLGVEELGRQETPIDGQPVECVVRKYVIADQLDQKTIKVFYSPDVAPYVLRREVQVTGRRGRRAARRSSAQVVAVGMPHRLLSEIVNTAHTKTVEQYDKGSKITLAVHAQEVPGEVVAFTSKELNIEGVLVRRSTMELIDFGYDSDGEQGKVRYRRARRRDRR